MPEAKAGDNVPELGTRLSRSALAEAARVTTTVYVFVLLFWAVTTVVMVLLPITNGIFAEGLPEATAAPLTVTVALASLTVGVRFMLPVALLTEAMYAVVAEANAGDKVPELNTILARSALAEAARVTTTVYVFIVPSCAVTTVVMVFGPTTNGIAPDGLPEATLTPFTVTVAVTWLTVGVKVMALVPMLTDAV